MILLFGAGGQLGSRLTASAKSRAIPCTALTRAECDFATASGDSLQQLIERTRPAAILNAAAWTAVDDAETNEPVVRRINTEMPEILAALAARANTPFMHFSTDYVFDGERGAPYTEEARTHPLGVYGLSKRDGERAVLKANPQAVIFRLQWLYDARGKNFLRTMVKLLGERDYLRVVADQRGAPTSAEAAAEAVMTALEAKLAPGIYHLATGGHTSWHGFACAIREALLARALPCTTQNIEAIATGEYPTPARRPKDTRLDTGKLAAAGITLPHWREGLKRVMDELHEDR